MGSGCWREMGATFVVELLSRLLAVNHESRFAQASSVV